MAHMRLEFVPVFLLILSLAVTFGQARNHYQPQDDLPSNSYNQNSRPHYRGSDLGTLNEDELETLLYLLEKSKGNKNNEASAAGRYYEKPIPLTMDSTPAKSYYYDARNKRTGHPQKKAIDWEDYFGIDKKKRSPVPNRTLIGRPRTVVGTLHSSPPGPVSHAREHAAAVSPTHAPVSTHAPTVHANADEEAEREKKKEKEKEEQIEEFYKNMAFATNMRRRKRDVSSAIAMQRVSAAIAAPQVLIPRVLDLTTTAAVPTMKDAPENPPSALGATLAKPETPAVGESMTTPATPEIEPETNSIDVSESKPEANTSENENVFLASTTTTVTPPMARVTTPAPVPVEMSRGDLEKLKAKLIKQINAAYSIEQLRQVLRDGSLAN